MNKKTKILDIKYICSSGGVVAPRAICGAVSVAHDAKGHRCTAHGNVKCKFKVVECPTCKEQVDHGVDYCPYCMHEFNKSKVVVDER